MALILLPWDLEEEILSRVPARSLRRLRFTCKRWNDLIKDREFIKKQLDKAAKQHMVLMLIDLRVYSVSENLHGIHDNVVVDPQTLLNLNELHNSEQVEIHKIFHCDGLLLCIATRESRLMVWNPCTGQIRWIQYSNRYKYNCQFALGYDGNNRSCQSYKILRYPWKDGLGRRVVKSGIYEFSSDSWRDLNDTTPKCFIGLSNGVSLKGNTYWLATDTNVGKILLCFDFSTEKFRSMCIPFANFGGCAISLSVVREERLSVLRYRFFHQLKIDIWMTTDATVNQTKDLSWSMFLSVDLSKSIPRKCFLIDTAFFIDEKNKAAVLCNLECYKMGSTNIDAYIVGEENRCIQVPVGEYRFAAEKPLIYSYVPSLVQIQ